MLDKNTSTRKLVEQSGRFLIQVPTVAQVQLTDQVGSSSLADDSARLAHAGVELFRMDGSALPFVAGYSAWLGCTLMAKRWRRVRRSRKAPQRDTMRCPRTLAVFQQPDNQPAVCTTSKTTQVTILFSHAR
ncbi:hypothetical protein F2P45_19025 [Massilia sp. CCM 8733]|uniref:Flavin reductase like domain-containing protein n=1 Tax=Massilia mucilaginosa TaxID=2609282 RepID=A0ABX0NWG5_9BURK|nr:hypothetical protein [Massilia mucilaginosa]